MAKIKSFFKELKFSLINQGRAYQTSNILFCVRKSYLRLYYIYFIYFLEFRCFNVMASEDKKKNIPSGDRDQKEKKRKESILDLSKYLEKTIRVKFAGGREASGVLKGYDPLLNLVLDNTLEYLRDPDDPFKLTEDTRELGLVVCRGTSVVLICPMDGMESIQNPFISQD